MFPIAENNTSDLSCVAHMADVAVVADAVERTARVDGIVVVRALLGTGVGKRKVADSRAKANNSFAMADCNGDYSRMQCIG